MHVNIHPVHASTIQYIQPALDAVCTSQTTTPFNCHRSLATHWGGEWGSEYCGVQTVRHIVEVVSVSCEIRSYYMCVCVCVLCVCMYVLVHVCICKCMLYVHMHLCHLLIASSILSLIHCLRIVLI